MTRTDGAPLIAAATSSYPGLPGRDARPQLVGVLAEVVGFFTGSLGYTRELPAIGDNPPSDDLRKALDAWFGSARRETGDWVVVYYTGHADVVGDDSLYLLTTDFERGQYVGTAFNLQQFGDLVLAELRRGERRRVHNLLMLDVAAL